MAISVVLQDERGNDISEMILDPKGAIGSSLPELSDASYTCLRFIDPYGDTVFNPLQAAVMVSEWDRLEHAFFERNAASLWASIRELIVRCSNEPHNYMRFIGD